MRSPDSTSIELRKNVTVGLGIPLDRQLMDTVLPTSVASSSGGLTMTGKAVRRNHSFLIMSRVYRETNYNELLVIMYT